VAKTANRIPCGLPPNSGYNNRTHSILGSISIKKCTFDKRGRLQDSISDFDCRTTCTESDLIVDRAARVVVVAGHVSEGPRVGSVVVWVGMSRGRET